MNGTKRPRAVVAPLLGGLVALALVLLAPRASASVPRAGEMVAPVERISASVLETSLDLSALERALTPAADVTEAPLFTLGDVALDDTERELRFVLGPMQLVDVEALRGPPESYPETRIRAFAFLGSTLIGVSRGVSLDLLPGYERIGLGLAEGDVVNLYAYVGLQPQAAVDPMGESLMGDLLHIGKRAAPKVATAVAAGFLLSAAGPFGVVIGAGMLLNTGIAIYGEVGGSNDPVAELLDLGRDVTGIRSAMEGMTGKEAGTGRALSREERLDAIGDAIGDGAAALAGKAGARLGAGARRMAAAGRGRTGRREASATGRRAGAESREGHARGGTRDHGAQATSRPTRSAGAAADDAVSAARKIDDGIGCPFRSFSPDTLVATAAGLIPIDQVAPGTEVWAADEETGERSLRKVSSTAFHLADDGLLLTVGGETLTTTERHPFFTAGGDWVEAAKLQVGQEIRSLDGELLRVEKVEKRDGRFAVFNFEVDEDHSYFVGDARLLAHNCGDTPEIRLRRNATKHSSPLEIRDFARKRRALERYQNQHGSFEFSPGTEDVRIAEAQVQYRSAIAERYRRRFGQELDLSRLNADHPIDMIAGGHPLQRLKMRAAGINKSFGSQIRVRGYQLKLKKGDRFRIAFDD